MLTERLAGLVWIKHSKIRPKLEMGVHVDFQMLGENSEVRSTPTIPSNCRSWVSFFFRMIFWKWKNSKK